MLYTAEREVEEQRMMGREEQGEDWEILFDS